jgi:hypothetical protein
VKPSSGKVGGAQRAQNIDAEGNASIEEHGSAGRARGHRPRVAEPDPGVGDLGEIRRARRRRPAVAEHAHLVDADVVHDDEQDVGRSRGRRVHVVSAPARQHRGQQSDQYHGDLHRCLSFARTSPAG